MEEIHEKSKNNRQNTKVIVEMKQGKIRIKLQYYGDILLFFTEEGYFRISRNRSHRVESARRLVKHYVSNLLGGVPVLINDWKSDNPQFLINGSESKGMEPSRTYDNLDVVRFDFDEVNYEYDDVAVGKVIDATTANVKFDY